NDNVAVPDAAGNGSDAVNGTAGRFVSSPEGTALAYGSLLFMALLPIFFGALRSVGCSKSKNASDMPETITSRDAARFPIIASCTLFGLYLFFKVTVLQYMPCNIIVWSHFKVQFILLTHHLCRKLLICCLLIVCKVVVRYGVD
uniref:Uncharacterized protein n=1 Tax=Cyprinus carpio TaxID=7962 RepID=A0A8C2CEZ6_CYPCA